MSKKILSYNEKPLMTNNNPLYIVSETAREERFNLGYGSGLGPQADYIYFDPSTSNTYYVGFLPGFDGSTGFGMAAMGPSGRRLSSFNINAGWQNNEEWITKWDDGNFYVCGWGTTYQGIRGKVARILPTGLVDTSFTCFTGTSAYYWYTGMAIDHNGKVYVCSNHTYNAGGFAPVPGRLLRMNSNGTNDVEWNTLAGTGFLPSGNYSVSYKWGEIYVDSSNNIIYGSSFTSYRGEPYKNIIRIDGSTADPFPGFDTSTSSSNAQIRSFQVDEENNVIYIAGDFTTYKGRAALYLAKINFETAELDLSLDTSTGFNGVVRRLSLDKANRKLWAVGDFTQYKGQSSKYLACIDLDTGLLDTTFNMGTGFNTLDYTAGPGMRGLAHDPVGKTVFVGGKIYSYNGKVANAFIPIKYDGSPDYYFDPEK